MAGGGPFQSIASNAIAVLAVDNPKEGRLVASFNTPFTPTNYALNQQYLLGQSNTMSQVRTLQIDNARNPAELIVTHGAALATTTVPAGGGAIIPTTSSRGSQTYPFFLNLANPPALEFLVGVQLYNYEIPPASYGTQIVVVNGTLPIGAILVWYGSIATIPAGFGLCDGTVYARSDGAGTITSPNLVHKFIDGAGAADPTGVTGGSDTILKANLPNYNLTVTDTGHDHFLDPLTWVNRDISPSPNNLVTPGPGVWLNNNTGAKTDVSMTGIVVNSGGSGAAFLPPYMILAYIMKF